MRNSKIEWCDHTFNLWEGWRKPLKWDLEYQSLIAQWNDTPLSIDPSPKPRRPRVFCASDWMDDEVQIDWLADLLNLIHDTPNLDWLLLTKRPENWKARMVSACDNLQDRKIDHLATFEWAIGAALMPNVWVGTTVEDQKRAEERIPELLKIPAKVRFLSVEPMLEHIDIIDALPNPKPNEPFRCGEGWKHLIHWVICGGESGRKPRPMHPDWARSLRDQCQAAGVPFLFKQWGDWAPSCAQYPKNEAEHEECERTGKHGDIALEPNGTIAEGYQPISPRAWIMSRVGKKASGRLLDGREWNEFPKAAR